MVLDTHAWIWWVNGMTESLPLEALEVLQGNPKLVVSVISCIEVAWLVRHQRVTLDVPISTWFDLALAGSSIELLPLTPTIAERAVGLPEHHKDPSDRVIIATAIAHDAKLLSLDAQFRRYAELAGRLLPA